jgi:hypothetical protein
MWTFKPAKPAEPGANRTAPAPAWDDTAQFARERLNFAPDEHQERVLRSSARRVLLACSRQWGKSTTAAVKVVHRAYTQRGSLILVLSPSGRQSGEFVKKARAFVERLGVRPRGDGINRDSILFPNGSRIVGLPGVGKVRGFSAVSLLLVEEAGKVPDESYYELRPTLAVSNGDLWIIGTPEGKRGFFYDEWAFGGDRWQRLAIRGPECSRISKDFIEEEREKCTEEWFRQEYLCEFLDSGDTLFQRELVETALDPRLEPLCFT